MQRLWQLIVGTRPRRIFVAVGIVALTVAIAAIVGSGSSSTLRTAFASEESCTSADVEANVRLTVYSQEGREACEAIDRAFGKAGSFWRVQEAAALEGELVCSLAKGGTLIEVRDTGGHFYGNKFCASLTGRDWSEQEGPGRQIEREKAQRESEARVAQERRSQGEETERERTAAIEQRKQVEREKVEETKEASERKKEELAQHHQEAQEEAARSAESAHEEDEQRAAQQKLESEEAQRAATEARERKKEEQERAVEQRKTEEETRRSNEGANQG
jgi:hypothetical protein